MGQIIKRDEAFDGVKRLMEVNRKAFAEALPRMQGMDVERWVRVALSSFRTNPALLRCNHLSLMSSMIKAATYGLEVGIPTGAYLVPYGDECQLVIDYRGLMKLARRSGAVDDIWCELVFDADEWHVDFGLSRTLTHTPAQREDRGKLVGGYACARYTSGVSTFVWLWAWELEKAKKDALANKRNTEASPWTRFPEAMMKKTLIRRLCNLLPLETTAAQAVADDERADLGMEVPGPELVVTDETKAKESLDDLAGNGQQAEKEVEK